MSKRILTIQAHPDASRVHLCHALCASYVKGAEAAGHTVRQVNLATLDFPLLRSQQDWEEGSLPAVLKPAQDDIGWAEHIVFFFRCGWETCLRCSRDFWSKWRGLASPSFERRAASLGGRKA